MFTDRMGYGSYNGTSFEPRMNVNCKTGKDDAQRILLVATCAALAGALLSCAPPTIDEFFQHKKVQCKAEIVLPDRPREEAIVDVKIYACKELKRGSTPQPW